MENNEKKERRVSFAAEVETVYEYEEQRPETTISSDEEFTADLTCENSKQLSIFEETTVMNEFMSKDVKELVDITRERSDIMEKGEVMDKVIEKICVVEKSDIKEKTSVIESYSQENIDFKENVDFEENVGLKEGVSVSIDTATLKKLNSPKIKKSKRSSFSPFRKPKRNSLKDKNEEQENEINSVESSMISNNSIEATEIINTQKLKFMIPQTRKPKSNITELFAMKGIMFLDSISFGKVRRDTLSKTRKPVDPTKVLFYQNYLVLRIGFFDEFVEELKAKSEEYETAIDAFVNENEEVEELISGEEITKNTKGMMLYARNLAKIEWYEMRAKKELAFNETIIQNKNSLQNKYSEAKTKCDGLASRREDLKTKIEDLKDKIRSIKDQEEKNEADKKNVTHKKRDIENYRNLVENLNKTLEDLKIKYNKNLLHRQIQENHVNDLKKEIASLLSNMRDVCVNEDQLNQMKFEFEKLCAIFEVEVGSIRKDIFEITFQGYKLRLRKDDSFGIEAEYCGSQNIPGQFMLGVLGSHQGTSLMNSLFGAFRKIYVLNEFVKELQNISLTNQTEILLKNKELVVKIVSNNFKLCKTVSVSLVINSKLECIVEKDGETYLYNLSLDKGFLLNHLEC